MNAYTDTHGIFPYLDHNDARGRENRLAVQAWNDTRARMLAAFEEYDLGCVTLYMSKAELQTRLNQARSGFVPPMTWTVLRAEPCFALFHGGPVRNFLFREPRNEREAAKLLRAQA